MSKELQSIKEDDTYIAGLAFETSRTLLRHHILDLEDNLRYLKRMYSISADEENRLKLLIHTHDCMKFQAIPGAAIHSKYSHATLSKQFASRFIDDNDLLNMIQRHDEPFSIFRHHEEYERLDEIVEEIQDLRLFLIFQIINNCIPGRSRKFVYWIIDEFNYRKPTGIDYGWVIE